MHGSPIASGSVLKPLSPATRAAVALVPITWVMLVLGSTVRAHGAGLACPDWPLCFGEIVPRLDFGVGLEFGHRVLGGVIGLLYLGLGAALFRGTRPRAVKVLWGVGAVLLAVQIVLGGLTVLELLAEWTVASHLVGGNAFSALLAVLALALWDLDRPLVREPVGIGVRAWSMRLFVLVFAQLALGGLVSSSGAGLACGTWPGCNGPEWFPTLQGLVGLQVLHRIVAYAVLALAVANVVVSGGRGRSGRAALVVLGLVLLQVALGVANVLLLIPVELTIAHAAGAALVVLATARLNYEAWRAPIGAPVEDVSPASGGAMSAVPAVVVADRGWAETLRLYFEITRPKVMALVVFTAIPALRLGSHEWPSLTRSFWILFATALAGAASSALNAYFERETDAFMARTRNRPLPAATLLPRAVLGYGIAMTVVSTALLAAVGGPVAAGVGLATIAFYVGVYTLWLKPRTPQNIVIGGAAGATAPLIASAATHGHPTLAAWLLFGIIFLWTPPHFWAISIVRREEYGRAGFPMMNLVIGDQATRWRSFAYALVLVAFTLLPVWFGALGAIYAVASVVLGAWFVGTIARSLADRDPRSDWRVFKASTAYLTLLFLTMIVDLA